MSSVKMLFRSIAGRRGGSRGSQVDGEETKIGGTHVTGYNGRQSMRS